LAVRIIRETTKFPKELKFGIVDQIRSAAISIPSNIAEGAGRNSNKQFKFFLQVAHGSCFELDTQIEIAKQVSAISSESAFEIRNEIKELCSMIFVFTRQLNSKP
jgi:four helix bundle protein